MVIELRAVQFWSEIILMISNRTRDFEITRMISDQIALHLVQLPSLTTFILYENLEGLPFTQTTRVETVCINKTINVVVAGEQIRGL